MRPMDEAKAEVDEQGKLGQATDLGRLALHVNELGSVAAFYESGVGLSRIAESADGLLLGSRGRPVLELIHRPDLPAPRPGSAGLYHTAILFEEQADLAAA